MSEIKVEILSPQGENPKAVGLPAAVFGCEVNVPLIHQVVVAQLAAARQGTHSVKTRGEVSGGGAKPWRQKGTGRARHGSRRAPQWTGGGTIGPHPRSYAQRTPKKMIAAALRSALSDRVADGKLFILDQLVGGDLPSTKRAVEALSVIGDYDTALVVLHRDEDVAWLSLRNVVNVHAIAVDQLNVYDIIVNQAVVFTKAALEEFLARFGIVGLLDASEDSTKKTKKATKTVPAATSLEPVEPALEETVVEAEAEVEAEEEVEAAPEEVGLAVEEEGEK